MAIGSPVDLPNELVRPKGFHWHTYRLMMSISINPWNIRNQLIRALIFADGQWEAKNGRL